MQWKWKETSQNGSRSRGTAKSLSGGTKINIVIGLAILVAIGWGVAVFSAPYLRKSKFQHDMAENMRYLVKTDEETMIQNCLDDAKKDGLPTIRREDVTFTGGVGLDSVLKIKYKERVRLFGDKVVILNMEAVKELKPPPEP